MELDKVLWGITTLFIITLGLYFSLKFKLIQFNIKQLIKSFKRDKKKEGISAFQSLNMSLGARIGVGSIAGVALAIYKGGPGTIFWLLLTSFLSAPNAYAESILSVLYREKDGDTYKGGPAYYIKKGLNKKGLAIIYSLLIIITYIVGFLSIQSNTITKSLFTKFNINPLLIGIIIGFITFIIIIGGVKKVAKASSKIVPFMSILYLLTCFYITVINIEKIPFIIKSIIDGAFNIKAFGFGVISSFIIGIQRGIFSSEAGIGTGSIAAATTNSNYPKQVGLNQIIGIYFTSLIICGLTSLVVLTSNNNYFLNDVNGIEIVNKAFAEALGILGEYILLISIILFAFSTIITGYYYGESNLKFLSKTNNYIPLFVLKIGTIIILIMGSIISSTILWQTVDILVAIMAIINLITLFFLRKDIIKENNKIG